MSRTPVVIWIFSFKSSLTHSYTPYFPQIGFKGWWKDWLRGSLPVCLSGKYVREKFWPPPGSRLIWRCLSWLTLLCSANLPVTNKVFCICVRSPELLLFLSCFNFQNSAFFVFSHCRLMWRTAAFRLRKSETSNLSTSETSLGLTVSPKVSKPLLSCELLGYFRTVAQFYFHWISSRR